MSGSNRLACSLQVGNLQHSRVSYARTHLQVCRQACSQPASNFRRRTLRLGLLLRSSVTREPMAAIGVAIWDQLQLRLNPLKSSVCSMPAHQPRSVLSSFKPSGSEVDGVGTQKKLQLGRTRPDVQHARAQQHSQQLVSEAACCMWLLLELVQVPVRTNSLP